MADQHPTTAEARCMCGGVRMTARFPSRFCAHCHCESCRRAHAAGFVTWIGFKSEQVAFTQGVELVQPHLSSPGTSRTFCKLCGTRLTFSSDKWPGETHIPLACFDTPVDREPSGNSFPEEHAPWIDLPKDRSRLMANGITGIILAGGLGRRMGGVDKGLQPLYGKPMMAHVLERLAPQVDALVINANQNAATYSELGAAHGATVVADSVQGFAGPLAGLQAGLAAATTPLVVTVPCDSPFLPADLVARLASAMTASDAQLAVAKTGDQPHPVFALVRADVRANLEAFLGGGGRKIDAWYAALRVVEVPFDDEAAAFENINTRDELQAFESAARERR